VSTAEKLYHELHQLGLNPRKLENRALGDSCPACINENGDIEINTTLPIEMQEEGEIHELYHLFLQGNGLICLSTDMAVNYDEMDAEWDVEAEFKQLARVINDAISHHILLSKLMSDYGEPSTYERALLRADYENISANITDIKHRIILLHMIGINLYDMYRCLPSGKASIESLLTLNPDVKFAFNAAAKYLDGINLGQPQAEQFHQCRALLKHLGHPEHALVAWKR